MSGSSAKKEAWPSFTREEMEQAQERVHRRRRLRLMLLHIDGAKCLMPLVQDMDSDQLDAMLNLVSSTETLESP